MADYMLDQANAFHQFLNESFKDGKNVLISELTNNGSMYCLLGLIAAQQVRISNEIALTCQVTLSPTVREFSSKLPIKEYRGRAMGRTRRSKNSLTSFRPRCL